MCGAIVKGYVVNAIMDECEKVGIDTGPHDPSVFLRGFDSNANIELDCLTEDKTEQFYEIVSKYQKLH